MVQYSIVRYNILYIRILHLGSRAQGKVNSKVFRILVICLCGLFGPQKCTCKQKHGYKHRIVDIDFDISSNVKVHLVIGIDRDVGVNTDITWSLQ